MEGSVTTALARGAAADFNQVLQSCEKRYGETWRGTARGRLPPERRRAADVEDVLQNGLLALYEKLKQEGHGLEAGEDVRIWMCAVVSNKGHDARKAALRMEGESVFCAPGQGGAY